MRARAVAAAVVLASAAACTPREGVDPSKLPTEDVRAGYAAFAARCSRCHALSRPLLASIDTQPAWRIVVQRMRLMSGSNITAEDEARILVFLSYLGEERRRSKTENRKADL